MDSAHPVRKASAFATGTLLAAWIGGVSGAGAFKVVYWLVRGVWPDTALAALAPQALSRLALVLPADDFWGRVLRLALGADILTVIVLAPPLLLVPCLFFLLGGRAPIQAWRTSGKPFSPSARDAGLPRPQVALRRDRGLAAPKGVTPSTNRGQDSPSPLPAPDHRAG